MRVDLLTREYPPAVYGGAGVHVEYLARELRAHVDLRVHFMASEKSISAPAEPASRDERVRSYLPPPDLLEANPALRALGIDVAMAAGSAGTDLVHSHTWYANLAGHLAKLLYGVPHVITAHSLEPLRPWKSDQLGGGYALSSWAERTAYESADALIAVSSGMRSDLLRAYPSVDPARVHVVHNGIDIEEYRPVADTDVPHRFGIDLSRPVVAYVGRVSRQKGLAHLLRAARALPPGVQLVLCAGMPDDDEILAEVSALVDSLEAERGGVVWIADKLAKADVVQILSAATLFVCPSVYEPMGIVNLEAMACEIPVVATATGGIPEVVDDGVTGLLVPIEQADDGTGTPTEPAVFEADLAGRINALLADPERARRMGAAGRRRVESQFSWAAAAGRTLQLYRELVD